MMNPRNTPDIPAHGPTEHPWYSGSYRFGRNKFKGRYNKILLLVMKKINDFLQT